MMERSILMTSSTLIVGKDLVSTSGHIHGCCGQDFSLIFRTQFNDIIGLITQGMKMEDLNAGHMPRLTPRPWAWSSEMHPSEQFTGCSAGRGHVAHGIPMWSWDSELAGRAGRLSSQGIPMNQVGTEQSMFGEQKGSYVVRIG